MSSELNFYLNLSTSNGQIIIYINLVFVLPRLKTLTKTQI